MSSYKLSFTSRLRVLEKDIIIKPEKYYSDEVKQSLWSLITYIESGEITSSEVSKFILQNFRLKNDELLDKWNNMHVFKQKKMETLRGQISELSSQLYEMFGNIDVIYLSEDMKSINRINTLIDALQMREVRSIDDAVIEELKSYFISDQLTDYYSPSECKKELALIKSLSKQHIYSMIDKVDDKKLLYVRRLLNQELISTKKYDFNTEKYDMIMEMKNVKLSVLKDLPVNETAEEEMAPKEVNKVQVPIPVPEQKLEDEYTFASMSELIQVMLDFIGTPADARKSSSKKQNQLNMLLELFTVEGLRNYLKNYCSADLSLYEYEKVHHN